MSSWLVLLPTKSPHSPPQTRLRHDLKSYAHMHIAVPNPSCPLVEKHEKQSFLSAATARARSCCSRHPAGMPPFPQTSFPASRFTPQVNDLTTTVRSGDSLRNQTHTDYSKFSSKHQRHSDRETKPVVTDGVQDGTYLLLSCTSQDPATGALQGGSRQQHCRLAQLITSSSEYSAAVPQSTLPKAGITDEGNSPVSKTAEERSSFCSRAVRPCTGHRPLTQTRVT